MTQDIFLKLYGIHGESQDITHGGDIEVIDWNWQVSQPSGAHEGCGAGAGKATLSDLSFEHYICRVSPNLMKYCLTGKHISTVTLTVRKAGGTPHEYLTIKMHDVIVTNV